MGFLIGLTLISSSIFLLFKKVEKSKEILQDNLETSLNRNGNRIGKTLPLETIFLEYKHESVSAWIKWIEGQDTKTRDLAYSKLVTYLDIKLSEVGEVIGEVLKAIATFKKPNNAELIKKYLTKVQSSWGKHISPENHFLGGLTALIKANAETAEKYIIDSIEASKTGNATYQYQVHLVHALAKLPMNEKIETLMQEILLDSDYDDNIRQSLMKLTEEKDLDFKIKLFKSFLDTLFSSSNKELSNLEEKLFNNLYFSVQENLISEDYDTQLWDYLLHAMSHPLLSPTILATLEEISVESDNFFQTQQIMELINVDNTGVRSKLRDLIAKRYALNLKEMELCSKTYLNGYTTVTKGKFIVDKPQYTHTVIAELQGVYKSLEKEILKPKNDKTIPDVSAIMGRGDFEKSYLIRNLALENEMNFVYVDFEAVVQSRDEITDLVNKIIEAKPCIVYLDNIEDFIQKKMSDEENNNLKKLKNYFKEMTISREIFITANILYNSETLREYNAHLYAVLKSGKGLPMRISINVDDAKEVNRKRIINSYQSKIHADRILMSETYCSKEMLEYTNGMNHLEIKNFLQSYFEIALYGFGKLVSIAEYQEIASKMANKVNEKFQAVDVGSVNVIEGECLSEELIEVEEDGGLDISQALEEFNIDRLELS